jgi:exodeoxyribonuclease X
MIVVDTETTGLGEGDQVVEFAAVWPGGHSHFLVRPTVPICPEARAAHHITDHLLASCGDAAIWRPSLGDLLERHPGPLVGHNISFDLQMISQTWPDLWPEQWPTNICTYRCALHLWPEAPSYSNQILRYYLGLEPVVKTNLPPHRALPDAAVTMALLNKMLETKTEQDLVALSQMPVVLRQVRFGKHRGALWSDVPRDYLSWVSRQGDFDVDVLHTARHYLGR